VSTYQTDSEFAKLLDDYIALPERRYVLEIGSMVGDTLRQWFEHGDEGMTLVSVDKIVPLPDPRHHLQNAAHAEWMTWSQRVFVIDGYSQDAVVIEKVKAVVPYLDFLFIDGGHDYATVKADYENYAPLVRPGGLIAFHDIQRIEDVKRFWHEIRGEHFAEYCDEGGMGIGSITKQASKPILNIITAYSRSGNLCLLEKSLARGREFFDLRWHIVVDGGKIQTASPYDFIVCPKEKCGIAGSGQLNLALDGIADGWVVVLDDDNLTHPSFFSELYRQIAINPDKLAFAFAQETSGGVRRVGPDTMKECMIDQAQFVIHRSLIGEERYVHRYTKDGEFAERLYNKHPTRWGFSNNVCTYYNKLRHVRQFAEYHALSARRPQP